MQVTVTFLRLLKACRSRCSGW